MWLDQVQMPIERVSEMRRPRISAYGDESIDLLRAQVHRRKLSDMVRKGRKCS